MYDKQAVDILILDVQHVSTLADYFVIATGTVDVHRKAIVEHIENSLASLPQHIHPRHLEGVRHLYWILMDYGDVIVHVFSPEARNYYQLEKLWGDVPIERFNDHLA